MTDEDDLTEAQCELIYEIGKRLWTELCDHEPEITASVIVNVLADFLGNWGRQHSRQFRRQMQIDIILSITTMTLDLLDMRDRDMGGPGKGKAH